MFYTDMDTCVIITEAMWPETRLLFWWREVSVGAEAWTKSAVKLETDESFVRVQAARVICDAKLSFASGGRRLRSLLHHRRDPHLVEFTGRWWSAMSARFICT